MTHYVITDSDDRPIKFLDDRLIKELPGNAQKCTPEQSQEMFIKQKVCKFIGGKVVDAELKPKVLSVEEIRRKRDALLQATDKYMLEDYPISSADKTKIKAYRKALRDITVDLNETSVNWPQFPL